MSRTITLHRGDKAMEDYTHGDTSYWIPIVCEAHTELGLQPDCPNCRKLLKDTVDHRNAAYKDDLIEVEVADVES